VSSVWKDVGFGLRGLARVPVVTAVVILTLALGIGATAATLSVIDAVLLGALPYESPEELFLVDSVHRGEAGLEPWPTSWLDFTDWSREQRSFRALAAYSSPRSFHTRIEGETRRITGELVTGDYFRALGIAPVAGRLFHAGEVPPPGRRVALIGQELWRSRFGSDPAAVGQVLSLNDEPYQIVGVLPAGFQGLTDEAQVWIPAGLAGGLLGPHHLEMRNFRWLNVIGRLAPGVPAERAQAELDALTAAVEAEYPRENEGVGARLAPLSEALFGELRPTLFTLLAGAVFVLLIACANVAGLLLARMTARGREIAVRSALGARRSRLVRQLLTESVLLSVLGGALGLLLAHGSVRPLLAASRVELRSFVDVGLGPGLAAVILAVSVLCGLAFGLVPALLLSRPEAMDVLKDQGRSVSLGRGRQRFQSGLVIAEVALALVLLISAGLMLQGFRRFLEVDLGFQPENVATARLDLSGPRWTEDPPIFSLGRQILDQVGSLPGVGSVAVGGPGLPSDGAPSSFFTVEDARDEGLVTTQVHSVSPGYFSTLGIPILEGRAIGFEDVEKAIPVLVVSRAFAQRYWPRGNAVGRKMKLGDESSPFPWFTIVGVAGDVRHQGLDNRAETAPDVYFSMLQFPPRLPTRLAVLVRGAEPGTANWLIPLVRRELQSVAPDLEPYDEATLEDRLRDQTSRARFLLLLIGLFALVALTLAVIGIYGLVSYSVTRRTREIATRVTLGADRGHVLRLILGHGAALAGMGIVAGILGALALTRFVASLLYGFSATDPVTFLGLPLLLLGVALLASWIPARRALSIDPQAALRME
jgi:putative ABC transport system permease protein